jgi:hypothetical protein
MVRKAGRAEGDRLSQLQLVALWPNSINTSLGIFEIQCSLALLQLELGTFFRTHFALRCL